MLVCVQDQPIHGERPMLWPLWLHAAAPGNISLYITIYYEMADTSSIIKYRTLRMLYSLQVCAWIWTQEVYFFRYLRMFFTVLQWWLKFDKSCVAKYYIVEDWSIFYCSSQIPLFQIMGWGSVIWFMIYLVVGSELSFSLPVISSPIKHSSFD